MWSKANAVVTFRITDTANAIPVTYTGILPDLFREGQGVVTEGRMVGNEFKAEEVLAKHDENTCRRKLPMPSKSRSVERRSAKMIAEAGHFALTLALFVAVVQSSVPLIGAERRDSLWMSVAQPAAILQFLLITFAFACLTIAFVTSDFSLTTVVRNSHTAKPLIYKISGVWGTTKDRCCCGC